METVALPSHDASPRATRRIRHELRFRLLQVRRSERINPYLIRVTLGGDELAGFSSPGFDDHVKLLFPDPVSGEIALPGMGPDGPVFPSAAPRPEMREYTPRRYDADANTLEIDFALHEAGPATAWALQASAGQRLGVGGPRASLIIPVDFDWHLLIGDDTALPAIARRLEELPAGARVIVLAEVENAGAEQVFDTKADVRLIWVHRNGIAAGDMTLLPRALAETVFPEGDYHAWIACESALAQKLREQLLAGRGARSQWLKACGYWQRERTENEHRQDDHPGMERHACCGGRSGKTPCAGGQKRHRTQT